ncbi:MAG: hypothetical protein INF90_11350 [Roseomonas sp.]|jgi:hypothetical protein|nr:hypothetical protein [Roseomonas sp.]MCA3371138.1 hypothetical protein [Roseomonas sp.]
MEDLLGWRSTRWGMTKADILNAIGSDKVMETNRQDFQRFYSELEIKYAKIGEFDFNVVFQMGVETHRLEQVLLSYDDLDLRDPEAAFRTAKSLLSETFGKPARVGTSDDWFWPFPTSEIIIGKFYIPEIASSVSIRFRPTGAGHPLEMAAF